jgi:hypothetical protein
MALILSGCVPASDKASPAQESPAPAAAETATLAVTADGGDKVLFTCSASDKTVRVDVGYDDTDGAINPNAQLSLSFGEPEKQLKSPAIASTTETYVYSASFAANADLLTAFYVSQPIIVRTLWDADPKKGSATTLVAPTGDTQQFGTDCAQITGQR